MALDARALDARGLDARGDCGGKLYVQVHGGALAGAAAGRAAAALRRLRLEVSVGEQRQDGALWGRAVEPGEAGRADQQVLKGGAGGGARWLFGSLASACERGAACPEPQACSQCTQRESRVRARAAPEPRAKGLLALKGIFAKQQAEADGVENVVATFESREFVFDVKDFFGRLPVSFSLRVDEGGRGAPRLVASGKALLADALSLDSLSRAAPRPADSSDGDIWQLKSEELRALQRRTLVRLLRGPGHPGDLLFPEEEPPAAAAAGGAASGRAATAPSPAPASASASAAAAAPAPLSALAPTPASGGAAAAARGDKAAPHSAAPAVAGDLVVEMFFVPGRSSGGPGAGGSVGSGLSSFSGLGSGSGTGTGSGGGTVAVAEEAHQVHDAVRSGQLLLVHTLLAPLRRKQLTAALTWRSPGHGNLNCYELAALRGQHRVLRALLELTGSTTWAEWQSGVPPGLRRNAMHLAALAGSPQCVQALAMHSYKHDVFAATWEAQDGGHDDLLLGGDARAYLEHRAHIRMLHQRDAEGRTPLALACATSATSASTSATSATSACGNTSGFRGGVAVDVVQSLLEFDADPAAADDQGASPLLLAVRAGNAALARHLLDLLQEGPPGQFVSRARPNMPDKLGVRPLHVACARGDTATARALLEAGALPCLRDKAGTLPLHLVAQAGHLPCVTLLLEWPEEFKRINLPELCSSPSGRARSAVSGASGAGPSCFSAAASAAASSARNRNFDEGDTASHVPIEVPSSPRQHPQQPARFPRVAGALRKVSSLVGRVRSSANLKVSRQQVAAQQQQQQEQQQIVEPSSLSPQPQEPQVPPLQQQQPSEPARLQARDDGGAAAPLPSSIEPPQLTLEPGEYSASDVGPGAEALENRNPLVGAVQWTSGRTAAELAEANGHTEVAATLRRAALAAAGRAQPPPPPAQPERHGAAPEGGEAWPDDEGLVQLPAEAEFEYVYEDAAANP